MATETIGGKIVTREQIDTQNAILQQIAAAITGEQSAEALDATFVAAIDGTNTTRAFWAWYGIALGQQTTADRYALLSRWFTILARAWAGKQYTLRGYAAEVSGDTTLTPMDDLAGKTASPLCTDADTDTYHWMDEDPLYWYIRANALSLADGTMNILAIEGESEFDLSGETAPVYTFAIAPWIREWDDGSYHYLSIRTDRSGDFVPDAGDVAPDNTKRALTWHPTFPGSLNSKGGLTSGVGGKPYNFHSANDGITAARKTTAYEGLWNDCDTKWLLRQWQLRHFTTENSNQAEGCTSYNIDYTPALAEEGVERILLTTAQGANILVGSDLSLSTTARGGTYTFQAARVDSVETVTVDGTAYAAVTVDNGGTKFDTATDMHLCSMPWYSGNTEKLPGHKDGCTVSLTAGKTPLRVAGVEVLEGAYAVGLDPLYQVTAGSDATHWNYKVYECRDSEKLAGSVTANYKDTGISYTDMPQSWQYVKAFVLTVLGILFPRLIGGSSTQWYKSAFAGASSAGVRCPWRFAHLHNGGYAGLACEAGGAAPSSSYWGSRPRLSGSGKKRGEWTA